MTGKLVRAEGAGGTRSRRRTNPSALAARARDPRLHRPAAPATRRSRRDLDVAESTVKIHVQHILRKLKLTSRVQAAVYAVEHGIGSREP